ncbi:MAG: cupin domain-containing protein [Methanocella sp.]
MDILNLYADLPEDAANEQVVALLSRPGLRIERIVSNGQASPAGYWYDQPQSEWVVVVRGSARLRFEGDERDVVMQAGDWIDIPAHRRHRVEWTDPDTHTIWLAIHYGDEEEKIDEQKR